MNDPETSIEAVTDSLAGAAKAVARLCALVAFILGMFGWGVTGTGWWIAAAFFAGAASISLGLYVMLRAAAVPPQ